LSRTEEEEVCRPGDETASMQIIEKIFVSYSRRTGEGRTNTKVPRWCDIAKYVVHITKSSGQKIKENKEGSLCWRMQLLALSECSGRRGDEKAIEQ
jgi:hypothetical protein